MSNTEIKNQSQEQTSESKELAQFEAIIRKAMVFDKEIGWIEVEY